MTAGMGSGGLMADRLFVIAYRLLIIGKALRQPPRSLLRPVRLFAANRSSDHAGRLDRSKKCWPPRGAEGARKSPLGLSWTQVPPVFLLCLVRLFAAK